MSFYLYSVLSALIVPCLMFGLLSSRPALLSHQVNLFTSIVAVSAGVLIQSFLPYQQTLMLVFNSLYAIVVLLTLGYCLLFSLTQTTLLLWQSLIFICAGMVWAQQSEFSMLTATSVLNTQLLLNVTSLVFGFALLAGLYFLLRTITRNITRGHTAAICILALLLLIPLSGDIQLSLMKLQVLDLSPWRLSYVSKVTNFRWMAAYAGLTLILLMLFGYLLSTIIPHRKAIAGHTDPIHKRKAIAQFRRHRNRGITQLLLLVLSSGGLLYWDLVASRPESLSASTRVQVAEDGYVHIDIDKILLDGNLHRYAWVAGDGKVVRFFIINRYPDREKLAVVFDACLLCGDQGYIQKGNQVICLACGVHIFIPSIGKSGGCNPIPMPEWQQKNRQILVKKSVLEQGLPYFSTIIEMAVTDPVNGTALKNTTAEHKYSYAGKTYFFSSDKTYQQFRQTPEKYVGGQ